MPPKERAHPPSTNRNWRRYSHLRREEPTRPTCCRFRSLPIHPMGLRYSFALMVNNGNMIRGRIHWIQIPPNFETAQPEAVAVAGSGVAATTYVPRTVVRPHSLKIIICG